MNTTTRGTQEAWTLLRDLIFGIPHPVLTVVEYVVGLLVIAALVGFVVRMWRGDRFSVGPVKIERPEIVRELENSLEALSKDDRLKANVLWVFRERLNEAKRIVNDSIAEPAVRNWSTGVLTDIVMALSEGGHDRHRASLWIRTGEELRMYNGVGFRQEAVDNATLPLASIAGNVYRTGTSYKSTDVDEDNAFYPKPRSGRPYKSLLAVPVKNPTGRTIATLCVDAEAQGYFDADHEFFASCFADLMALLIAQVVTGDEM